MHNKGNKLPAWLQACALNSDNLTLLVDTASAKPDILKWQYFVRNVVLYMVIFWLSVTVIFLPIIANPLLGPIALY